MDPHTLWLRREVARSALRSLTIVALAGAAVASVGLAVRTELSPANVVAWSILAGQALALGRLAWATLTNPLNTRYLRRYHAAPHAFVPVDDSAEVPPGPDARTPAGAAHRVVLRESTRPEPVHFELVQSGDRQITMATGCESGSVSLLSELDDGRLLVTTSQLVVPRSDLVVRQVAGGDADELAAAHRSALDALSWFGVRPVAADTTVLSWLHYAEHAGYVELGVVLGSLLDIDGTGSAYALRHCPEPDEVFRLGLESTAADRIADAEHRAIA